MTTMPIATMRKLEVVHKQVGGYPTRCARVAALISLNSQWWINHSVRPIFRYRATKPAWNLELNLNFIICSYFLLKFQSCFFHIQSFLSYQYDLELWSDLQILQRVHIASTAKYSLMNRQKFTELPPSIIITCNNFGKKGINNNFARELSSTLLCNIFFYLGGEI